MTSVCEPLFIRPGLSSSHHPQCCFPSLKRRTSISSPQSSPLVASPLNLSPPRITVGIELLDNSALNPETEDWIAKANEGLLHYPPELCEEGVCGTYFLKDIHGDPIGVFKPIDEEAFAENSPKDHSKPSSCPPSLTTSSTPLRSSVVQQSSSLGCELKKGITVGDAAKKEVAAYLLDHGFAGVPTTVMARCSHWAFHCKEEAQERCFHHDSIEAHFDGHHHCSEGQQYSSVQPIPHCHKKICPNPTRSVKSKIGSFQKFVCSEASSWDISPSLFDKGDVHSIALLDLRILNLDRHGGNILVCNRDENRREMKRASSSMYKLVPIDHGYSLPNCVASGDLYFEWLFWPQTTQPFDEETKEFVRELDEVKDEAILKKVGINDEDTIVVMKLMNRFVKRAVERGWTLRDMGSFVSMPDQSSTTALETLFNEAREGCPSTTTTTTTEAQHEEQTLAAGSEEDDQFKQQKREQRNAAFLDKLSALLDEAMTKYQANNCLSHVYERDAHK